MYVILNVETDKYVARRPVRGPSYVRRLQDAQTWATRDAADRERCPGNERVLSLAEAMGVR